MENEIDRLSITIDAEAQKANTAIDLLADKLDRLYTSLGRIDGTRLHSLANGVSQLSAAVKGIASIDGRTFSALAKNINKIANVDSANLMSSAYSVSSFAQAFNNLGATTTSANNIGVLASSISKLGGKNVQVAITNLPQLAQSLKQVMSVLATSPKVSTNIIRMTNALANLASQGSKVGSASNSIVNGINRTNAAAKRTASSTKSLAAAFGKFYANYFLLVRGFKALFGSMESAMELTETVNYFNVTLNNIGESARENWKKYGYESADAYAESFAQRLRESNEKLTGFTVDEAGKITQSQFSGLGISPAMATQYSAMFAQVANSIGMTEEASIALSEAFVRLGADWASLRNVDFEVAYEKLASGLSGQSRALRTFGLDITMASLQSIAFANGIEKSVSEMTQSEKSYLRLIAIIEQSEVAFGDLANTLASPANQMRMLSQGIHNLGTLVGNLFLPILQRVLPVLNGFVIALQRMVIAISETMGIDTSGFTSIGGMDEGFGDLSESVDEATESAEKFNRATRGWDELNVLGKDIARGYGVGNDLVENEQLLIAYDDAIEKYRKAWDEAYDRMENEAEEYADRIMSALNLWDKDDIYKGAEDFGKNIAEFLNNTITVENFSKIGETVATVVNTVVKASLSLAENFDFSQAGKSIAEGINSLFEELDGQDIAKGLNEFVDGVFDLLIEAFKNLDYEEISDTFADFFDEIELDTLAVIVGAFVLKAKGTTLLALLGTALKKSLIGEVSLQSVALNIKGFSLSGGGASFTVVASKIWEKISDAIENIIPDWSFDFLSKVGAGLVLGAAGGSWFPGAGTVAGAIVGAITGAMASIKVDGSSILSKIFDFEKTEHFFELSVKAFEDAEKAFNERDWGSLGLNILKSIGSGLLMFPSVLFEPIWNLGSFIIDSIKNVLGFKGSESHKFKWFGENAIKSLSKSFTLTSIGDSISDWYENKVKPLFSSEKWNFNGIKEGFEKAFNSAFDAVKGIWNGFAKFINNALELDFDGFSKKFNVFGKKIEVGLPAFTVTLGKLPTFQTGGFPEDGLFMANHNELVGKFSNGKTAVANNDQITKGIEEAAYRGMMRALNQSQGRNSDVNVYLQGDAAGVFKLVQNENSRMKKVTGKSLLA